MLKISNHSGATLVWLAIAALGCEIHVDGDSDGSAPPAPSDVPWSSQPGGSDDCQHAEPGPAWDAPQTPLPTEQQLYVDRFKSLMIIDPSVLEDARARNDLDDVPWSFRSQLEWLAGSGQRAPELALHWLEQWADLTAVGPSRAPVTPRPAVRQLLIGPWQASEGGDYDTATRPLDLGRAPFRLLAIVARTDLASDVCTGSAGELRYVYAALDATSALPLSMTVIIELPLPSSRTAQGWARAFRALSDLEWGEGFNSALEQLTREVARETSRDAARVRTNEVALGASSGMPWELREFRVHGPLSELELAQVPLESTPRGELSDGIVDAQVLERAEAALSGKLVFSPELQAGAAPIPHADFKWQSTRLDESLRSAFSRGTCNGCHGGESEALPFQHVAPDPQASDRTRLSRFLDDPDGGPDELGRREQLLLESLTTDCEASAAPYRP
jgi:hypothetical protein